MQKTNQQAIEQQLKRLHLQQAQLQTQLAENNRRMQHIVRRVWQLNDTTQKRIANDLHDGVGQILTALVNELSALTPSIPQLERATALATLALKDTRHISRLLRPPVLDDLGLQAALNWLIRQITESCPSLSVSLALAEDLNLADELQILVFRICQEALTNVVKYAKASQVQIAIKQDRDGLTLTIMDNGIGFELDERTQTGVGLCSMQDRAASFGGRCLIEAAMGQGCKISIMIPHEIRVERGSHD